MVEVFSMRANFPCGVSTSPVYAKLFPPRDRRPIPRNPSLPENAGRTLNDIGDSVPKRRPVRDSLVVEASVEYPGIGLKMFRSAIVFHAGDVSATHEAPDFPPVWEPAGLVSLTFTLTDG
jgi:hypothetical protein